MVVRMRANRSKTGKRRSHQAISGQRLAKCDCGALRVSHRACPDCGKYNGRIVIDVVARAKRQAGRSTRKETELRASGKISDAKEKVTAKTQI